MLPRDHFLIGTVVSVFLYFIFPEIGILNLIVFLLASVLIDVDHYLYYVYRKKDWSLRNAVRWFMKKRKTLEKISAEKRRGLYTCFCFLHGFETLVLFGILGYFIWDTFYFVALGFLFHLCLDYFNHISNGYRLYKISIIYDYFKQKKLKFI